MDRRALTLCAGCAALALAAGCGDRRASGTVAPAASGTPGSPLADSRSRVVADFVKDIALCDVAHRGPVIDVGADALIGRFGWSEIPPAGFSRAEHDGSTWARLSDRRLTVSFTIAERAQVFVAARAVGYAGKNASVFLDDQPLGTLAIGKNEITIAETGTTTLAVDPGVHTVTLGFSGHPKSGDPYADVDWIRIGIPDELPATYGAPTMRDLVAPKAAFGGVPHRALALRAPGSLRCALRLPGDARLRVGIAAQGNGEADAELLLRRDGEEPTLLRSAHVAGGAPSWNEVDVGLGVPDGAVAEIELVAKQTSPGVRVLFGDPRVELPTPPPPPEPPARGVVVVVLDGVERGELPPWRAEPTPLLPTLSDLALTATTFDRHRAPSTVVAAALATLLTGLPPHAHGLGDSGARLPTTQATLATLARDASVHGAMFTGVPFSFRAFGFANGWERFSEVSPVSVDPATHPIDLGASFVTEMARARGSSRFLLVVHARGAHPPWDVNQKELAVAPPKDYAGIIDPRRAAQSFARLRKKKARTVIGAADRERIRALETIALSGQDKALGALVTALKTTNLWDSTLFVVTGDVGSGVSDQALFGDGLDLRESLLELPLYVHFPDGRLGGKRVGEGTTIEDVTATALVALGLVPPKPVPGRDLAAIASGRSTAGAQVLLATLEGRYSARWGEVVLSGKFPRPPMLCDLLLDPTCSFNRRDISPIATTAMFRRLVRLVANRAPAEKREPATLDNETAAALKVWGAMD